MIVKRLGPVAYDLTLEAMRAFTAARTAGTADEVWLCEHPPVFTQGVAGKAEHVLDAGAIPVVRTDRGGQVTYHGPGQVVAYPLVDLRRLGIYVKEYVFRLEQALLKTLEALRRHRPPRCAASPGSTSGLPIPSATPRMSRTPADPFARARQDRRDRRQGQPPPHVPRRRPQRRDGPGAVRANQSVRSCRAEDGRSFYNRRSRCVGRRGHDPRRQARRLPEPVMTPSPGYDATHQAEGRGQDLAHPDPDRSGRRGAEEARLDPRQGRLAELALLRDQADPARAQAAHGVRGSVVPEHRRVLRQRHRDVHDHGRQVHPALPVLRRRPRPARSARRRRAAQSRQDDRGAEAEVRRHHQRRPRRPARRRRRPFRRLHREGPRALAGDADRDPHARLPRPRWTARSRSSRRRRPT